MPQLRNLRTGINERLCMEGVQEETEHAEIRAPVSPATIKSSNCFLLCGQFCGRVDRNKSAVALYLGGMASNGPQSSILSFIKNHCGFLKSYLFGGEGDEAVAQKWGDPSGLRVSYPVHPLEQILVVQAIFKYLNVRDLLTCCLVCKTWHFEARRTLQTRRKCIARLWFSALSTEELRRFSADINRMSSTNPYNGLDIFHHCWHNKLESFWKMEEPVLPSSINLKFLTIRAACKSIHCPAFRLIMKILYTKLSNVEELVILDLQHDYSLVRKHYYHLTARRAEPLLPKLKVLDFGNSTRQWWDVDEAVVGALVSQAPNLTELRGTVHLSLLNRLPASQVHAVKSLAVFAPEDARESSSDLDSYVQFCLSAELSLKKLSLATAQVAPMSHRMEEYLEATCSLLRKSHASLESLHMDSLGLVLLLLRLSNLVFPALKALVVNLDLQVMLNSPIITNMIPPMNLSAVCPSLLELCIHVNSFLSQQQFFEVMLIPLTNWLEDGDNRPTSVEYQHDSQTAPLASSNRRKVYLDTIPQLRGCITPDDHLKLYASVSSPDGKIHRTDFGFPTQLRHISHEFHCNFANRHFLIRRREESSSNASRSCNDEVGS